MRKSRKSIKIINRTGQIPCQVCGVPEILVEHHIEGRDIPDANHFSNIARICDNCHRRIHEGIVIIEGWFQSTHGMELLWHKKEEEGFTGQEKIPFIIPKS